MAGLPSHDVVFKRFLGNLDIERFLDIHLPTHLKPLCDLSTLQIESSSFIEEDLRQHYADIVYSLKIREQTGYVYALLEHQSDAPPLMPFRMLRYVISIMKQHLDQGHKTLPIVIPLVFYRGTRSPYPGPVDILACFAQPELAKEVFLKPFTLIDLSIIPDEELRSHRDIALLELVQKHIHTRDLLNLFADIVDLIQRDHPLPEHVRAILRYAFQEGDCTDPAQLVQFIETHTPQYREDVMTLAQQFRQQGRQEGEKNALRKLLQARFPQAPIQDYQSSIEEAAPETLTQWIIRAATAATLADVFTFH